MFSKSVLGVRPEIGHMSSILWRAGRDQRYLLEMRSTWCSHRRKRYILFLIYSVCWCLSFLWIKHSHHLPSSVHPTMHKWIEQKKHGALVTRVEPISVRAPVLAISGGTCWRRYCFGKRKEKNLMRDPARSSTNSRKSTLLCGKSFLIKVTVGFPVWVGCWFSFGEKCFGAWCAKNENGGSCRYVLLWRSFSSPDYDTTCSPNCGRLLIHHFVPELTHDSQCMQDGRRALELVETNLTGVSTSAPWNSFSGINFQRNQDQIHIRKKRKISLLFIPSLVRVRRPCRGLEKFFPPVLQRCYGCSFHAQEIVHTGHGMLGYNCFFSFFSFGEKGACPK